MLHWERREDLAQRRALAARNAGTRCLTLGLEITLHNFVIVPPPTLLAQGESGLRKFIGSDV